MKLTKNEVEQIAQTINTDYASLMAFITVGSGGTGFNTDRKIIIQFEPAWFKKYVKTRNVKGKES